VREIRFKDRTDNKDLNPDMPFLLGEADYAARMHTDVDAWRRSHLHHGVLRSFDDAQLHYYYAIRPKSRGTIVVVHGFCEFIGKYRELLYSLNEAGYNVFFLEQRGHGRSVRETRYTQYIYVRSFRYYVEDLKCMMDQVVLPITGRSIPEASYRFHPVFLLAHSMGGAVGTLFLEQYPEYFDAAVLSSPMHRMLTGGVPDWQVRALLAASRVAYLEKRPAPGQGGFNPDEDFAASCGSSRARFEYVLNLRRHYPEYQTGGATYGWIRASLKASGKLLKNAKKVQIPVLLLQARDDTLVDLKAQDMFAARSGNTTVSRYEGCKHELMNGNDETRYRFYREILDFYGTCAEKAAMAKTGEYNR